MALECQPLSPELSGKSENDYICQRLSTDAIGFNRLSFRRCFVVNADFRETCAFAFPVLGSEKIKRSTTCVDLFIVWITSAIRKENPLRCNNCRCNRCCNRHRKCRRLSRSSEGDAAKEMEFLRLWMLPVSHHRQSLPRR